MPTNKETIERLIAEGKVIYPTWIFGCPDIRKAQESWKKTMQFQGAVLCALMREALEPLVGWRKAVIRFGIWLSDKWARLRR